MDDVKLFSARPRLALRIFSHTEDDERSDLDKMDIGCTAVRTSIKIKERVEVEEMRTSLLLVDMERVESMS